MANAMKKNILPIICKIIFWTAIFFLCASLWTYTLGQSNNIEFKDSKTSQFFYEIFFIYTPIAILLTLFGTIKKSYGVFYNIFTSFTTVALSVFIFYVLVQSIFTIGFGAWTTTNIPYQHKENPSRQIKEQLFDLGALGYGGTRVVELQPFMFFFNKVNEIDTNRIDKKEWQLVNKNGDLK